MNTNVSEDHIASLLPDGDGDLDNDQEQQNSQEQQTGHEQQAGKESGGEEQNQGGEGASQTSQAQQEKETQEGKPPQGYVPYGALHEERMMRKQLSEQLTNMQQQLGQFQSLREELNQLRQSKQQQTEEERAAEEAKLWDEDPLEALRRKTERLEKMAGEYSQQEQKGQQTTEQQQQQMEQMRQLQQSVREQVNEYAQVQPDYPEAFKFVLENRIKELEALGYNNPEEVQQILNMETMAMAQSSLQRGVNPGESVYKLAQAKGYKKSEGDQQQGDQQQGGQQQGGTMEEQLDRIERGQQASKSLSGGAGAGKPGEEGLSLSEIEKMSDKEFDELWTQMERAAYGGGE